MNRNMLEKIEKEVTDAAFKNGVGRALYDRLGTSIPVVNGEPTVQSSDELVSKLGERLRKEGVQEQEIVRMLESVKRADELGEKETHKSNAAASRQMLHED